MALQVEVNMISDIICPWCYIGFRRLAEAIRTFKGTHPDAQISWKTSPFLLDPELGNEPISRRTRLSAKFGEDRAVLASQRLTEIGANEGIHFDWSGKIRQTVDSHRLLAKAYQIGGEEAQYALQERLFKGHFEQGRDNGDHKWLAEEAAAAGVGAKDDILAFLAGTELITQVRDDMNWAQSKGIEGVPFFIVNGKYGISGAQDASKWVAFLEQLANGDAVVASSKGPVC